MEWNSVKYRGLMAGTSADMLCLAYYSPPAELEYQLEVDGRAKELKFALVVGPSRHIPPTIMGWTMEASYFFFFRP